MKPVRIVVLALGATLAMSAVLTANALGAEAELVNKVGNALVKNHFSATGGAVIIETAGGNKVKCASSKSTGVITSKTAGEETVTFSGCEDAGIKCNSEGQSKGVLFLTIRCYLYATSPQGCCSYGACTYSLAKTVRSTALAYSRN